MVNPTVIVGVALSFERTIVWAGKAKKYPLLKITPCPIENVDPTCLGVVTFVVSTTKLNVESTTTTPLVSRV